MDLVNNYRTFHPMNTDYTFFSGLHGTFSRIDHMIEHKASLTNFKKIGIISCTFLDHQGVKLETNKSKCLSNIANTCRLDNMLFNKQWVREEIKNKIKIL